MGGLVMGRSPTREDTARAAGDHGWAKALPEVRERPTAQEYEIAATHHLAIVLLGPGAEVQAASLGGWSRCRAWWTAGPGGVVCAWVGRGEPLRSADTDRLIGYLSDWRGSATFGMVASERAGFAQSHRQALQAHAVALVSGDRRLRYETARYTMLAAHDRDGALAFVRELLGPIAALGPQNGARLLATLQAYLEHGHKLKSTSQACGRSRDTIARHVREIEGLLGCSVESRGAELLMALRLRRVLKVDLRA